MFDLVLVGYYRNSESRVCVLSLALAANIVFLHCAHHNLGSELPVSSNLDLMTSCIECQHWLLSFLKKEGGHSTIWRCIMIYFGGVRVID